MALFSNTLSAALSPYELQHGHYVVPNQLIVEFPPDVVEPIYKQLKKLTKVPFELLWRRWLDTFFESVSQQIGVAVTVKQYSYCDRRWVLVEGEGLHNTRISPGGDGPDGTVKIRESFPNVVSVHLDAHRAELPDALVPISEEDITRIREGFSGRASYPKVAVLDTGFDHQLFSKEELALFPLWFNPNASLCSNFNRDVIGWNFVDNHNAPFDDSPVKHGTKIARILARQTNGLVQIIPLKTHNGQGIGTLFSVLCALAFARKAGANVVNCSWGMYHFTPLPGKDAFRPGMTPIGPGLPDASLPTTASLSLEVLRREIAAMDTCVFITAAGNALDFEDNQPRNLATSRTSDNRRLKFYPACFDLPNTVSVTTLDLDLAFIGPHGGIPLPGGATVRPVENFSNADVDLGVIASGPQRVSSLSSDWTEGKQDGFTNPLPQATWESYQTERRAWLGDEATWPYQPVIRGSSYAVPFASARLAGLSWAGAADKHQLLALIRNERQPGNTSQYVRSGVINSERWTLLDS